MYKGQFGGVHFQKSFLDTFSIPVGCWSRGVLSLLGIFMGACHWRFLVIWVKDMLKFLELYYMDWDLTTITIGSDASADNILVRGVDLASLPGERWAWVGYEHRWSSSLCLFCGRCKWFRHLRLLLFLECLSEPNVTEVFKYRKMRKLHPVTICFAIYLES